MGGIPLAPLHGGPKVPINTNVTIEELERTDDRGSDLQLVELRKINKC